MRMNYGIVVALAALCLLATLQATARHSFQPRRGGLQGSTSGSRIGSLEFTGPGIQGWHVSIPLRGVVTGLVVQRNPQTPPSVRPRKRL